MNGFRKYLAKLLVVYIGLTNVMTPTAFAAQVSDAIPSSQTVNEVSAPAPIHPTTPVAALPVSSNKFNTLASVLGISTNDAPRTSANKRLGVSVQKLIKHDFKADEDITMMLNNPDQEKYKTKIVDASGKEAKIQMQQNVQNGITQLQVIPTNQFQPGKYTISVTDETGKTTTQDFTWGVLALNPDKAIYATNETADLSMAVLDDKGAMVCNAQVSLEIRDEERGTSETLSTEQKTITVNPECSSHSFSLKPDYEAHYQFHDIGKYVLLLTAQTGNGSRTITDEISVQDSTPFEIQRKSATRIYPPNEYPMQINVTANQNFKGTITETVPYNFAITPSGSSTSYDAMKTVYLEDGKDPSQRVAKDISTGLVMPFDGNYPITQGFGTQLTDPTLQLFYSHYGLGGHDGVDFGLPIGKRLYAVDAGKILWAGPGDYGIQVIIQHSWGKTYYGHLSKTSVTVGMEVQKGSFLGNSGSSGESTGPHLHFGMKPNNADMNNGYSGKIDPLPYLPIGNSAKGISSLQLAGLQSVLGASDSADASPSGAVLTPTPEPTTTPTDVVTPSPSISSGSAATETPSPSVAPSPASAPAQQFTIDDSISQQSAEDQPQSLEKVKVIKWQVNLKKGDNIKLSYNFKTPQVSPQFYLIGALKFYSEKNSALVFDEGRQWQIAADDIGTGWYHPATNPNSGYEWRYRKKLTIDHTKVGLVTGPPVIDQTSTSNNTSNANLTWAHTTSASLSNSVLVVAIGNDNLGAKNVNTVTYNGVGLSQIPGATKTFSSGAAATAEIWYMLSPPAGTFNITVHYTSSSLGNVAGAATFSNVNQSTPFGTVATAGASSAAPSVTVTSTTSNQVIIEGQGNNGGTSTATGGQTVIGNSGQGAASYKAGSNGSTTVSWSMTSGAWAEVGVAINGATSGTDQSNFPVLVSLPSNADLLAHETRTNADDLVFTDSGGENQLKSEVESYNTTNGTLVAWVNVTSLSSSTDTDIYMYYGNGSAPVQSSTSVWDSNFRFIHHLGSLAVGAASACNTLNDSTSNAFNFSCTGPPTTTTGQVDGAYTFNGSSAFLSASPNIDDTMTAKKLTVSGWFNTTTVAAGNATILRNDGSSGGTLTKGFVLQRVTNHLVGSMFDTATRTVTGTTTLAINTWYYGAMVYNGTNVTLYLNGAVEGTPTAATGTYSLSAVNVTAGASNGTNFFSGNLDELHVSDTNRTASWISTEYANQSSPSTFIPTVSSEETDIFATTNDRLMRHGKFWDTTTSFGEQPFLF